ncbi:MAG TPA: hypothetical protein VKN76_00665 [Kiloniellaceae bacterium]|nr:hypothetical protein [Kiloniellaceae bacterium]
MPLSDSPTPWSFAGSAEAGFEVKDSAGKTLATTGSQAVAQLLAAAPDLLTALDDLIASGDDEILEEFGVDSGPDFEHARKAVTRARYGD